MAVAKRRRKGLIRRPKTKSGAGVERTNARRTPAETKDVRTAKDGRGIARAAGGEADLVGVPAIVARRHAEMKAVDAPREGIAVALGSGGARRGGTDQRRSDGNRLQRGLHVLHSFPRAQRLQRGILRLQRKSLQLRRRRLRSRRRNLQSRLLRLRNQPSHLSQLNQPSLPRKLHRFQRIAWHRCSGQQGAKLLRACLPLLRLPLRLAVHPRPALPLVARQRAQPLPHPRQQPARRQLQRRLECQASHRGCQAYQELRKALRRATCPRQRRRRPPRSRRRCGLRWLRSSSRRRHKPRLSSLRPLRQPPQGLRTRTPCSKHRRSIRRR